MGTEKSASFVYLSTPKEPFSDQALVCGMGRWKQISFLSFCFFLVQLATGSEKPSTVKWPGFRNPNWTTMSRTQGPDVSSSLHVAQCRATCFQKFNNRGDGVRPSSCFQIPDCSTCWKSCELLQSTWKTTSDKLVGSPSEPMCSHPRLCLSGCQVACRFHQGLSRKANSLDPVVPTSRENVLHFSDGKIQWPRRPSQSDLGLSQDTLVFVVIQQYPDHKWRQITQTSQSEVEVPHGLSSEKASKLRAVCVLVVSPGGLVSIFYPEAPSETELSGNEVPSLEVTTGLGTESSSDTTQKPNNQELLPHKWDLRKLSLIHQKFLVIAELTWNHLPGAKDYLITWELDGGGLKGHLVTDSNTVTLSLWPDTLYHIQVQLFGEEGSSHEKSFPVAVDTSEAGFPMERALALSKKAASHKSVTQFLNVTLCLALSASILVLLPLVLLAALKFLRRRSRDPQLLQHMDEPQEHLEGHAETRRPCVAVISPASLSILPKHLQSPFQHTATRSFWPLPCSPHHQPCFSPT